MTDAELDYWRSLAHDPDRHITTPIDKADLAQLVDEIDRLRAKAETWQTNAYAVPRTERPRPVITYTQPWI